jgi:hypothetical protein
MWDIADHYIWVGLLLLFIVSFFVPKKEGMSKKTAEKTAKAYRGRHQYQTVTPQAFPKNDLAYYEDTQHLLEERGFRLLGDLENLTLKEIHPNMMTFIRCMTSADGTISAGIYDVRYTGWIRLLQLVRLIPKKLQMLDLETEFNDGTFLCTSNSKDLDQLDAPPAIRYIQYPQDTDLMDLLNVHCGVIAQWTAQNENYTPLRVSTLEEGLEAQHRMQDLKNIHRQEVGLLTREEMQRIAGGKMTHGAEEMLREHQKLSSGELHVEKPTHHKEYTDHGDDLQSDS